MANPLLSPGQSSGPTVDQPWNPKLVSGVWSVSAPHSGGYDPYAQSISIEFGLLAVHVLSGGWLLSL